MQGWQTALKLGTYRRNFPDVEDFESTIDTGSYWQYRWSMARNTNCSPQAGQTLTKEILKEQEQEVKSMIITIM